MLAITTNSAVSVFFMVLWMIVGATAGIALIALAASELLRVYFSSGGDRDEELMSQGTE